MQVLKTVTLAYNAPEDRLLAVINAGMVEAWSGWLTRRLVLMLIAKTEELVTRTSPLAQKAPPNVRPDVVAFERDAAIVNTAKSMSQTPAAVIQPSTAVAELVHQVTVSKQGDNFRVELRGAVGGAAGMMNRADLQRIVQMIQVEVAKAGWLNPPAAPPAAPAPEAPKPARH